MKASALRPSLRRELLLWLLLPLLAFVPLAAALLYGITVRPALDSLDRALSSTAVALSDTVVSHDGVVSLPLSEQTKRALLTDPFDTVRFSVSDDHGRLLDGDPELAALRPRLAAGERRFFDALLHGSAVRVAAFGAPCGRAAGEPGCPVLVAESVGKRDDAQRAVLGGVTLTSLLLAAALVTLGAGAVRRGLQPLRRLSSDIERRSLENLKAVDAAGVPLEVAPLVTALNRMLERLRVASLAQQAFLADAAHQLRTPLTLLRTESELALLEPHPPHLAPTLQRLHSGAARAARLANQLLVLARAEGSPQTTAARPLDLKLLCAEAAQDWLDPALDADIDLGFELETAWVTGHAHLLREALSNLLHNANEYAGSGARVTVRSALRDGHAVLEVEDSGPGVPAADRDRLWQRFQRGEGAVGSGSGLGLAIVRNIATLHGADVEMHDGAGGRGLCVTLRFPAVSPPPAGAPATASLAAQRQ
jgi:two-component system sensor histidine kinase TctE